MDIDTLLHNRESIEAFAGALTPEDIAFLVPLLEEKSNQVRYCALLALQYRSKQQPDVYPYWDVFAQKLSHPNSYQRSIGILLISENIRWDCDRKFPAVFHSYMRCCRDERFITSRQAIQSIVRWVCHAPDLLPETVSALMQLDLNAFQNNQRKLILMDIIGTLLAIRIVAPSQELDSYIRSSLESGILDKKSIRQVQKLLSDT